MKASHVFLIALATFIGQSVLAESFVIINTLPYPVTANVRTDEGYAFSGTIAGNKGQSPIINIGNQKLAWIDWDDEGNEYKAAFEEYRSKHNGNVPLQKNKKNFFNIQINGAYYHNFGGYLLQGVSLE